MSIGDVTSDARGSGARFNGGKVRLDLIPLPGLIDAAAVFEYGSKKYAPWNWAKGMAWSAVVGCKLRHLMAMQRGEEIDPESGLPHVGHLMCNALMLATYRHSFPEGNDFAVAHLGVPAPASGDVVKDWPGHT